MPTHDHTTDLAVVPALAGSALLIGAVGLLTADAFTTGKYNINHFLQPLLVIATIAAAVWVHRSLALWRPFAALAFLIVAVLGSFATVYATLDRTAASRDTKVSIALAENRQLSNRNEDLEAARAVAKTECKSGAGVRCTSATARVDSLVTSMANLRSVSTDPRGDALADLLFLIASVDKVRTKTIVAAIDPLVLPVFLEVGSIVFFAGAFRVRRVRQSSTVADTTPATEAQPLTLSTPAPIDATPIADNSKALTIVPTTDESERQPYSRDQALADFRQLRTSNSQQFLAHRWAVSEGTVSKWMSVWEELGAVDRHRNGKAKQLCAIEARARPRLQRKRLSH